MLTDTLKPYQEMKRKNIYKNMGFLKRKNILYNLTEQLYTYGPITTMPFRSTITKVLSFMDTNYKVLKQIYEESKAYSNEYLSPQSEKDKLKVDAMRHILASARIAKLYGKTMANTLGYSNELAGALKNGIINGKFDSGWKMDESNNKIGIKIGLRPDITDENILIEVKKIIDSGDFYLEDGKTKFNQINEKSLKEEINRIKSIMLIKEDVSMMNFEETNQDLEELGIEPVSPEEAEAIVDCEDEDLPQEHQSIFKQLKDKINSTNDRGILKSTFKQIRNALRNPNKIKNEQVETAAATILGTPIAGAVLAIIGVLLLIAIVARLLRRKDENYTPSCRQGQRELRQQFGRKIM